MAAPKKPDFQTGDHVQADFGDGNGAVIGHVLSGPHENGAGETKYTIQKPGGGHAELGWREPKDRDSAGAGGTFWSV